MAYYSISPTNPISGNVKISGSKNASLPIIAATLLSEGSSTLHNVPLLSDTSNMCSLIKCTGAKCTQLSDNTLTITPGVCNLKTAPLEIVNRLRASFLIIGPVLARSGKIRIPLPGGCQIGARPIDLHLKGFASMGAKIKHRRRGRAYL